MVLLSDVPGARSAAEKVPPSHRRFHWSGEEESQRLEMLDLLVDLDAGLWSYECNPCSTRRHERARAKCFERLLWDLRQLGVEQLVIESRGPAGDKKDRRTILGSMKAGVASSELRYEHRRPAHDSGLWLADALAGVAAAALTGRVRYRDRLGSLHEQRRIWL